MKFSITIEGESASDLRILREVSALLNSSTSATTAGAPIALPPMPIPPAVSGMTAATGDSEPEPVAPAGTSFPGLDKDGLPWDGRIHASTGARNADNSWRGRRGVDAVTKSTVEAELRARVAAAPVITAPPVPQPAFVTLPPPIPQAAPVAIAPPPAPVAVPVAAPVIVAPPPPAPQPEPAQFVVSFESILGLIDKAVGAGKMDASSVNALAAHLGAADLNVLQNNPGLQMQAYNFIAQNGWYVA